MLCAKVKYEVNKNKTESKMENPTHSFREINHAGHTLEIFGLKGQVFIKKTTFFEIRDPKISPPLPIPPPPPSPYSIPFLSVLHQNKAFHNFLKRKHRSIVKRNKV